MKYSVTLRTTNPVGKLDSHQISQVNGFVRFDDQCKAVFEFPSRDLMQSVDNELTLFFNNPLGI